MRIESRVSDTRLKAVRPTRVRNRTTLGGPNEVVMTTVYNKTKRETENKFSSMFAQK